MGENSIGRAGNSENVCVCLGFGDGGGGFTLVSVLCLQWIVKGKSATV